MARVEITAADGEVIQLVPNVFSNFFRHFPVAVPLQATVYGPDGRSIEMRELAPSGDCNSCHFVGGPIAPIVGP